MAASTEAGLTTNLRLYIKGRGGYVNKNHGGPNSVGRPDLEGCYRGFYFGFEVKLPGKERNLTKLQAKNLEEIRKAGGVASVVTCKKDVTLLIDLIDRLADEIGKE